MRRRGLARHFFTRHGLLDSQHDKGSVRRYFNSLLADAVKKGKINPYEAMFSMYTANIKNNEQSPQWASTLAGLVP